MSHSWQKVSQIHETKEFQHKQKRIVIHNQKLINIELCQNQGKIF